MYTLSALKLPQRNTFKKFKFIANRSPFDNALNLPFRALYVRNLSGSNNNRNNTTTWINHPYIPNKIRPYFHLMRLDKQIGTMLLLWPCWWSTILATSIGHLPDPIILAKFSIGAILMRSAGCIINDMWDKDFDKNVERTKNRPLANGDLSYTQASALLFATLSTSLGVLLSMNYQSILLGFYSMPLVIIYPLMKRYTHFPQLVLGMVFNWGAFIGWTEVMGVWDITTTLPLYIGGVFWTLVYDTIYGYQDIKDDKRLGLKSTAIYLGEKPQVPLSLCAVSMIGSIGYAGYLCDLTTPFFMGLVATSGHLAWQIATMDIQNRDNLWKRFQSNQYVGALITLSILAGHF